jgi:signal transduction histidine kinase
MANESTKVKFIANARLKDIVGRELINDDNVAIIELIKNSKDAGSNRVNIRFGNHPKSDEQPSLVIQDSGHGMTLDDIKYKWLNIAYSEKKHSKSSRPYAGNKGIGRFSCDRLGAILVLYTKVEGGHLIRLELDWKRFEVDDRKQEIGMISATAQTIDASRLKVETGLNAFSKGTVLHVKELHESWDRERLSKLRQELERFSIDPATKFAVHLYSDDFPDDPLLNGIVENKVFETLGFRTTMIVSEICKKGKFIDTTLLHDGKKVFSLREQNPYSKLSAVKMTVYFLNTPAKALFKRKTGYRSVEYGSIFLFLNGFRVLPYGSEGNDWLGIDRRKQQAHTRHFGTRDLVGMIEVSDVGGHFKAVSSREGVINNQAYLELTAAKPVVRSSLDPTQTIYGFFSKVVRKLEGFVVTGLDWDRIDNPSLDDEKLLDEKNYEYQREKQRVLESLDSIITLRTPKEHIIDLEVDFKNVLQIAQAETLADLEFVEGLQEKFTGIAVGELSSSEKKDLSKFLAKQVKKTAAKDQVSERLEKELEVQTKRRLFAEFERSTDVEHVIQMHHQTRLLAGKVYKSVNGALTKHQRSPEKTNVDQLIALLETIVFDIDKIRKVAAFASKAKFNLATNKATIDLLQFIEEYVLRIEEISARENLKVRFENPQKIANVMFFKPLEIMMLVDNIIDNSIKARAKNLRISVTLSSAGVRIQFSDDGIGFPEGIQKADLFEKGVTTTSGSGIGLFHVRQIVSDLQGKVSAKNNPERGASIFLEFAKT